MEEPSAVNEAIAAAAFVQTIQRDLNCLSDPDRLTRRRALERLQYRLTSHNPDSPSVTMLQVVWDETILRLIVRSLHDTVEKCREAAVNLITSVSKLLSEVEQTTYLVLPAAADRIGQLPVLEQSEEIRLNLVNLLMVLTSRCSAESLQLENAEPLYRVICLTLTDSFHEIKKASCILLSKLSSRTSDLIKEKADSFLKALLPNIAHTHSRVRLAVLSALNDVVLCELPASIVAEYVAPGIKNVGFDHSDAVREILFTCIARWLGYEMNQQYSLDETKNQSAYMAFLLPLLLLGISDESPNISEKTLALVDGLGEVYRHWNPSQSQSLPWRHDANVLPPPFKEEPSYGSRLMVQRYLPQLLRRCAKDLHDWTTVTRLGAARLMQTTLVFAEGQETKHLDVLIPSFCSAVGDDDVGVAQHIVKSAHILGFNSKPDHWLGLILDPVTNPRASSAQRANALVVLAGLLYGTSREKIHESFLIQMFQALSGTDLYLEESIHVRRQLLAVLANVVDKAGALCKVSSKEIFVLLLQIESIEGDKQLQRSAKYLIERLAQATGRNSSEELYACHMRELIDQSIHGHEEWTGTSPTRLFFHAVLQKSGVLAGPYLSEVLPVFVSCLRPERDPALRLGILQLLDELFETTGLESAWSSLAKKLIENVLLPCGIWQAGKVGAAVRHAAMVGLGTFLRRGLCSQADLIELLETGQLLPVVTSCLEEDFYVDTRRTTCHVVEKIVHISGLSIEDEYRTKIGSVLQRRLDDSNDEVRLSILRVYSVFFSTLPSSYTDAEVRSYLSSLVLHMDDQNMQIKESVCKAVEVCAMKRPALVMEIVKDLLGKHQSNQYCDYLLTVATNFMKYALGLCI